MAVMQNECSGLCDISQDPLRILYFLESYCKQSLAKDKKQIQFLIPSLSLPSLLFKKMPVCVTIALPACLLLCLVVGFNEVLICMQSREVRPDHKWSLEACVEQRVNAMCTLTDSKLVFRSRRISADTKCQQPL